MEEWDKVTVSGGGPPTNITQPVGTLYYSYRQLKDGTGGAEYRKSKNRYKAGLEWGWKNPGAFNNAVAPGTAKNWLKEWSYYSCTKEEYEDAKFGKRANCSVVV